MEGALFDCPANWEILLPPNVRPVRHVPDLAAHSWDILALTAQGCVQLEQSVHLRCHILLVPGGIQPDLLARLGADAVISYGLSHRDSLTLSSLEKPVLCVQRELPRPDGGVVEPQEVPLGALPGKAEELLPLLGLRLLQMPLGDKELPAFFLF